MKLSIPLKCLVALGCWVTTSGIGHAQGSVQFINSVLTSVTIQGVGPVPTDVAINYGVFWGTTADTIRVAPSLPLGKSSTTTAGNIVAATTYLVEGTTPGQSVYLRIRGWDAGYGTDWAGARDSGALFGETPILPFALGPTQGPATVIWSSFRPDLFRPLVLVPEPSGFAIAGVALALICCRRRARAR